MANKPELLSELTPEDKLLIELLVDGELDELDRKSLLIRMDHLNGGWRFCAIAFLEAQCISSVLSGTGPFYQISEKTTVMQQTPPVSVMEMTGNNGKNINTSSPQDSGPWSIQGNAALATEPQSNDILTSEQSATNVSPAMTNSDNSSYSEPIIIPMHRGKYSDWSRGSSYDGGSGGGGRITSWHNIILAMVGGFCLAFLLSGILMLMIYNRSGFKSNHGSGSNEPFVVNGSKESLNNVPLITNNRDPNKNDLNKGEDIITSLSNDKKDTAIVSNELNKEQNGKPVKLVTLKSAKRNLDNLVVPCIESNSYNPESLKKIRQKNSQEQIEKMRKNGHDVETIFEELVFPLKDGRVLIVPVDTYYIHTKNPSHYQ